MDVRQCPKYTSVLTRLTKNFRMILTHRDNKLYKRPSSSNMSHEYISLGYAIIFNCHDFIYRLRVLFQGVVSQEVYNLMVVRIL